MSMFANSDLLEEIVETTEEQEADICSSGETVDECNGQPLGEFVEEVEYKHQPHLTTINGQHSSISSSSSSTSSTTTVNNSAGAAVAAAVASAPAAGTGRQQRSGGGGGGRSAGGGGHHHHHHHQQQQQQQGVNGALNGTGGGGRAGSRNLMEKEKRMRREIANSNERRRMQSINAGFQSLRTLLPHHEGEKLSKAAILQQTAEYIYQLEQQKTQLLSQNLQLKRLVDQQEGGEVPTKKRKHESQGVVVSLPVHVSESGDEGLGSMSPEPLSVITVSADGHATVASNEIAELKRQLERERMARSHLEKQISTMQSQIFPERYREEQLIAYQPHEVIEHTNNVLTQDLDDGMPGLQVVSVVSVPTVGSTQTVETSNADSNTPPLSPQTTCEIIVPSSVAVGPPEDPLGKEVAVAELLVDSSRPNSPQIVSFTGVPVFASALDEQEQQQQQQQHTHQQHTQQHQQQQQQQQQKQQQQQQIVNGTTVGASFGAVVPVTIAYATSLGSPVTGCTPGSVVATEFKAGSGAGQFITASPIGSFSPERESGQQQRLPSVLEAAIKAEPKVEVERLPSPSNTLDDGTPQARLYLANTSRQNLETIVEAIRHLEGDHLFSDEPAQDVPLALTNKLAGGASPDAKQRLLHAEVNNFLQFHTTQQQQQQQQSSPTQQRATSPSSTSSTINTPSSTGGCAQAAAATATLVAAATAVASQQQQQHQHQHQQQTQQRPGVIVVKHS